MIKRYLDTVELLIQAGRAVGHGHAGQHEGLVHHAVGVGLERGQVAGMVRRRLRAMRLAVWVEVAAGAGAVGAGTTAGFMDVKAMLGQGFEPADPGVHHQVAVHLVEHHQASNLAAFDGYAGAVARLRDHHLQTWAAFTLGYDHDTVESILATCEWGISNHFTFAAFNILMPYPATPLYKRLKLFSCR